MTNENFNINIAKIKARCVEFLNHKRSLTYVSALMSIYTLLAFHYPFFSHVVKNVNHDFSGVWIVISMVILMPLLNYLVYYLLLYLGRIVGKCIIAFTLIGNAICLYFIVTYNVLIDRSMMANVFNTQLSESISFLSWTMLAYALLLGVLPTILLVRKRVDYGSIKRLFANVGVTLVLILGIVGSNYKNVSWIDRHSRVIGSKLMPWSYIINSMHYYSRSKLKSEKEVILPDAEVVNNSKDIVVLIIGESARSKNFSLYGYEKETNPLLKNDGVVALKSKASDTYTLSTVRAILQHKKSRGTLYEILPNYLERNGVDVIWRRSNWGTPPLHIAKQFTKDDLKNIYPEANIQYDGILFHGLQKEISSCDKNKIFIGIHTYTSHGPEYYHSTPPEFKKFKPESQVVELSEAKYEELVNAYDNTIVYTDYLVHSVIEMLKSEFPDRRSCVIFISDHGESLGEGGFYMHGVPMSMAPAEQLDIPFIIWTSDNSMLKVKEIELAGHHNIYHSVLKFLGLHTSFYDESKNIFE